MRVPLGTRSVVGCVVDTDTPPPAAVLKDVLEILDAEPFLPAVVVDLAKWVGEYYAAGPGDALSIAMPPGARRAQRTKFRTVRVVELVDQPSVESRAPLRGKQHELMTALAGAPAGLRFERDKVDMAQQPEASHIKLAAPENNGGATILRRGYSFVDGSDGLGRLDAGLFFLAYQRDPLTGFVTVQKSLSRSDVLNEYIRHTGSGVYACPPGLSGPDSWWGDSLFG